MGHAALAVIHAEPRIAWQASFAATMAQGLTALGVPHEITSRRERGEGLPILLGTSCWRGIEATGPYLLVDRCSLGDTRHWVTLVRDGHGRRGDHRVPKGHPAQRWEWMEDAAGVQLRPWGSGRRQVLCGQTETYSPRYATLDAFYAAAAGATHFRKHPSGSNPTGLPECRKWDDVGLALTLNSSVGVEAVLAGVPTVTLDEGAMAWDVTGHRPDELVKPARLPWLHWLAWAQWSHDEIAKGKPWAHLLS